MVSTRRIALSAVAALGLAAITGTAAAQLPTIYAGVSAGQSGVEDDTLVNFKENGTGYKAFAGANWGFFGVEGGYVDLGKPDANGVEVNITGWDAFGVVRLPLGVTEVFAKAGMLQWDSDVTTVLGSGSDSGSDTAFGAGIAFPMGDNFAVRAEYERFNVSDVDRVDLISAGVEWRF